MKHISIISIILTTVFIHTAYGKDDNDKGKQKQHVTFSDPPTNQRDARPQQMTGQPPIGGGPYAASRSGARPVMSGQPPIGGGPNAASGSGTRKRSHAGVSLTGEFPLPPGPQDYALASELQRHDLAQGRAPQSQQLLRGQAPVLPARPQPLVRGQELVEQSQGRRSSRRIGSHLYLEGNDLVPVRLGQSQQNAPVLPARSQQLAQGRVPQSQQLLRGQRNDLVTLDPLGIPPLPVNVGGHPEPSTQNLLERLQGISDNEIPRSLPSTPETGTRNFIRQLENAPAPQSQPSTPETETRNFIRQLENAPAQKKP